jgi:hypothetical protein
MTDAITHGIRIVLTRNATYYFAPETRCWYQIPSQSMHNLIRSVRISGQYGRWCQDTEAREVSDALSEKLRSGKIGKQVFAS